MEFTTWLSLAAVCALGAMSPGPSLAVVIRNTLLGNRVQGFLTAWSHAAGIAIYAFLTAAGLAVLVTKSPVLFDLLRYGGAVFLAWLGFKALTASSTAADSLQPGDEEAVKINSIRDGFLIAFLNPKIALFFLALFSQFVRTEAGWGEKLIMTATATGIDGLWYSIVTLALSQKRVLETLRKKIGIIDKILGVILLLIVVKVVF